jgi:methionine-rich copper-binding protein CopC
LLLLLFAARTIWVPEFVGAHASYASSVPAANATVSAAPVTVQVTFTETVQSQGSSLAVLGPGGSRVDVGDSRVVQDGIRKTMTVSLQAGLGAGVYTVNWTTVSLDDGHEANGSFTFTIASAATPAPAVTNTPPRAGGGGGVRIVQGPGAPATVVGTAVAGNPTLVVSASPSPWGQSPPTATPTLLPVYARSADQQIVGTWLASDGTNSVLAAFSSDGTVITSESGVPQLGPSLGSWAGTGEREVSATWLRFRVDGEGRANGTVKTRSRIQLNAALDACVAEMRVDEFDLAGAPVTSTRATFHGRRIAAETP